MTTTATNRVRVSISLSTEEAFFLYSVLRDTGNGGPLLEAEDGQPDDVGDEGRKTWRRLINMTKRAVKMHGMV